MTPTPVITLPTTAGFSNLSIDQLLINGVQFFLGIIAIAAFFSIIYSGVAMITSNGDAAKFASARNNIIWAIIGIIVAMLSFVIVNLTYQFVTTDPPPPAPGPITLWDE